jgi:hypothetical protein
MTGLFVTTGLLHLRTFPSATAADQLNTILLFCLLLCSWFPSEHLIALSLCAIAVQVLFCYASNGLIKAMERRWWDGSALRTILCLEPYSRKKIMLVAKSGGLQPFRLLSVGVIVWELSAVCVPFLPASGLWIFLTAGVLFHLTLALLMGLNLFFWTFLSAYPAILFLNHIVNRSFH